MGAAWALAGEAAGCSRDLARAATLGDAILGPSYLRTTYHTTLRQQRVKA
jgi:hypothetical protein